ncbi:MAG: hypothetical protein S4CHLAM37_16160 [Chlamydiia bacterium]|nr:hypothetical protein [Chlamydiia bacterium]
MSRFDELLTKMRKTTRVWNLYALAIIKRYKYWDKLLSLMFNYSSRCYYRKGPLEMEKLKNPCIDLKYFSDNFGRFSTSKTLIGKVTFDPYDLEVSQHLLDLAYERIKKPRTCELTSLEILSKVVAYRDLKENTTIKVATVNDQNEIVFTEYVVDTIFDLWKTHVAFGLIPKDFPKTNPILLFRGTDFSFLSESGRASIISDLDPDGPGRRLYFNSRSSIRQWLSQMENAGKRARVLGHSLGGVLALYTLLFEHELLAKEPHASSFAFNPPGISEELLDEWSLVQENTKPHFVTFVTRGDIISKFGNLFGDVYEAFTNKPLSPVLAHEQLVFSQPISYIVKIDSDKENYTRSRKYYSKIQKQTTSMAFRFGLKYLFPNPNR